LQRVRRRRLYEQVIEALARYVRSEGLAIGDRLLPERTLAEQLGISRPSLKQALIALEVQGLIETRHGGGSYLRSTELASEPLEVLLGRKARLPDVLDAREAIEVKLAGLAAERRTEEDLREIDSALDEMELGIGVGLREVEWADARFHEAIAAAARSAVLATFMAQISDEVAESRRESLRQPGRPSRSLAQHRRVAHAVRIGDALEAGDAMGHHLATVRDTQLLNWQPDL
jgi:GntR family transcriptional regulator, transcriptional repressor for pyruvate dehydrogenase complex